MMLAALVMQGPPASGAAGAALAGTAAAGGAYGMSRPAAAAPRLPAPALRRLAAAPSESAPGASASAPGPLDPAPAPGASEPASGAASRTGGEPAPKASSSWAGSPQGEGRSRPGRPDSAVPDPFASDGVPVYTDRDPPQPRQPTGDGRRVDGDRARGTADAVKAKKPKAAPSARDDADGRDGADPETTPDETAPGKAAHDGTARGEGTDSGSADDEGVDRKGPGRSGTSRGKVSGSGVVGELRAAPEKWRAQPARNVRDEAPGSGDRVAAAPRAAEESTFRPLPFGSGLILIGLGLGFLGVRLRRS